MKQISVVLLSIVILFSSCKKVEGEGPVVTEVRNHTGFTGIDLRSSADVYYKYDSVYKVEVKAQQNILDVLITEVTNNVLVIRYKNDVKVRASEPIQVIITAPQINNIRNSGSGDIRIMNVVSSSELKADISGTGDILLNELNTLLLDANISGSGDIKVNSGMINEEKLKISGSGDIDVSHAISAKASTIISGSGNIWLNVSQNLDVTISGSGSVYYKGQPAVRSTISGSGKVRTF
jgi:hypothetical protein